MGGGRIMSTYIPTVWKNNTTPSINATNLNHMEAGVLHAHEEIEDMIVGATPVGHATTANIATSVTAASRLNIGGILMWVDTTDPDNPVGYIEV